ncbi:MAG: carboxypeptidase regulatory-like domain-containing protein [Gemmatimonadota bacterium]|nr:carboxypeptidase regulatory-like domain-containing protein [Gemmatimonadota bacterium]
MIPLGVVTMVLLVGSQSAISADGQVQASEQGRSTSGAVVGTVELSDLEGAVREDRSDVLVFLDGVASAPAGARRAVVTQQNRAFSPKVLPVLRGTVVDFPNDDGVFHNLFSLSRARPFDLGVYGSGETRSVSFPETGLVQLFCNIHPDMEGSVVVLSNPYFAVTDREGRFEIRDVPPGTYVLRTWHRLSAETRQNVVVSASSQVTVEIRLQEDRRILPHTNKFGKRYRRKY